MSAGRDDASQRPGVQASDVPGKEPTDAELLQLHVLGSDAAFAQLVARHRDRLWAVAVRTLGGPDEAPDALQDALVSACRGAAAFRGEAAVTTWLHRIVVNACLDLVRRRASRAPVTSQSGDSADPRDEYDRAQTRIDVRAALATLPFEQRAALVLVDMHAMPVSQAAAVLGVPEGTIKSRCARGRAALRPLLAGDERPAVQQRNQGRPAAVLSPSHPSPSHPSPSHPSPPAPAAGPVPEGEPS